MLVNGVDISTFSATLLGKKIGNHEVVQVVDWLEGAGAPIYLRTQQRFKAIRLSLLLESSTDAQTEQNFSNLLLALRKCTLTFADFDKRFDCHFEDTTEPTRIAPGAWILELELLCSRTYLPEITDTASGVLSKSITNPGTVPSGCIVTITPTVPIAEFTLTGLSSAPIKVKNLSAGKPHVIDGLTYRYLKDSGNDIANYSAFEWPVIQNGTTNILFSHSTASVSIWYAPGFS